jgi:hypothetical protein
MLALFRDAITDQPTGVHRTWIIKAAEGKADRMAMGRISGSAIKLWPLGTSSTLAVGEGIETVLAAVKLGVADPPAWATTVANNMSRLPLISGVSKLTILADNDASHTGEGAARELRREWVIAGREAVVRMPTEVGRDFNDLLLLKRGS